MPYQHNSLGNTRMNGTKYILPMGVSTQYVAKPYLLQGTQSEACLNCHESTPGGYHISTPSSTTGSTASPNGVITQFTPGGDFHWLTATDNGGSASNGHSINAPAYGYLTASETKTVDPGGVGTAYPTANLNCSSCHYPHGKYRRIADTATWVIEALHNSEERIRLITLSRNFGHEAAMLAGR